MLRVVIIKPSKYGVSGYVERFRRGFLPNATLPYIRSLTPPEVKGLKTEIHTVDEYVRPKPDYLSLLQKPDRDRKTLLALVGVQSHQLHRALDLAAVAVRSGCMTVIGGPHPMTCDTTPLQGHGVSFALAEAELVWPAILEDAIRGELSPVYGKNQRWSGDLEAQAPIIIPPEPRELKRYLIPMLGLYPSRGCPFNCNFCSVVKIAGHRVRSQTIDTTIKSLRNAKSAGVKLIIFCSDNFNKYPEVKELLEAMIEEKLGLKFFCQCDAQIAQKPELVELMARAGCFQIFVGVESFNRAVLLAAHKTQNYPNRYRDIIRLCREHNVHTHFSNIIGFPDDTEEAILANLAELKALDPTLASFYILCPIPGTEQYDDFLARDLITEQNLDRFDATCLTWNHLHLSSADLTRLFRHCYREFFSLKHVIRHPRNAGYTAFARLCARSGRHPMSGGIWPITSDHLNHYIYDRYTVFGITRAPLPQSLKLPASDEVHNRTLNPARLTLITGASTGASK